MIGAAGARPGTGPFAVLRSSALGLVLKAVGIAFAWAGQVVLARALGVEAFGVYATVTAWSTVLGVLAGFGMPLAAMRFLSVYLERQDWAQYRGFLRAAMQLILVSSIGVGVVVLGVFAAVPALSGMLLPMAVAMLLLVLIGYTGLAYCAFLAEQQPVRAEALTNVARSVWLTVLAGLFWWSGGLDHPDVATAAAVAVGLTVGANLLTLLLQGGWLAPMLATRWRGPAVRAEQRDWLAAGMTAMVSVGAFAVIERLDTILLGTLVSPAEAGPYSIVARVALLVSVALAPVAAVASPKGAQLLTRGDRPGVQRVMSTAVLITTGLAVVLCTGLVLGGPLLLALFGREFVLERSLLALLMAGQLALALAGPAGGLLAMAGRNRILVAAMVGTALLDLVLCLVLIPRYGMYGAGMATSIALAANAAMLSTAALVTLRVDTTIIGGMAMLAGLLRERRAA